MRICRSCCASTPNTTFSGTLLGCSSGSNAGAGAVTITSGGSTLWSGTANSSGVYSGSIYLASNTTVTITGTPTDSRFQANSISRTLTAGGSNAGLSIAANPATGYVCTAACKNPISKSITATSGGTCSGNSFPNDTLTYAGTSGGTVTWNGTAVFSLTIGGTYTYRFTVNSTGSLGLGAVPTGGGLTVFLCNPVLGACEPLSAACNCAATGIGITLSD